MPKPLKMVLPVIKQTIIIFFQRFLILKGIKIAVLVQKLWRFCSTSRFCLMVELYMEGVPPPLRKCTKVPVPVLMKLHTTPPSILTLGHHPPWLGYSERKLAFGHNNPTVCSLACRWRLRSALRADRESFSINNPRGRQLKAQFYSSELSYRPVVLQLHQ